MTDFTAPVPGEHHFYERVVAVRGGSRPALPVVLPAQHLPNRSDTPVIKISAKWLREAGFEIGTGVTVKISEGCLILLADNNEVQELRRELYQVKQAIKGMRDGMFSVLNES